MGTEQIPTRSENQTIFASHINLFKDVLKGIFVPRNVSGIPEDVAGDLGSTSFRWNVGYIKKLVLGAIGSSNSIEEVGSDLSIEAGAGNLLLKSQGAEGMRVTPNRYTKTSDGTNPGEGGQSESATALFPVGTGKKAETTISVSGGRPVLVMLRSHASFSSFVNANPGISEASNAQSAIIELEWYRGGTKFQQSYGGATVRANSNILTAVTFTLPASSLLAVDFPPAGTHTYSVHTVGIAELRQVSIFALEL